MEIERKYLCDEVDFDLSKYPYKDIDQAYISIKPTIRIRKQNDEYVLTIKGKGSIAREEYELMISKKEYEDLLKKVETKIVSKRRYFIPLENGYTAEYDIYKGELTGLYTVEVEFKSMEDSEKFIPPKWFKEEVSEDGRYKNTVLALYGLPK